jgi:hypothetical protein
LIVLVVLVLIAPAGARADVRFGPALASTASDPATNATPPALAGNAAGVVAAAYSQDNHVYARIKPTGTATFGAPSPLGGVHAESPAAAVAADGTVTVAWQEANPCVGSSVWIATAPPGGAFGSPVKISANAFLPHLAVAPDGTVMVLYSRDIGSCKHEVRVQIRPRSGSPEDTPISDAAYGSANSTDAAIGIDDNGNAYAAFPQSLSVSPFTEVLRIARRPAGGSWTATTYTASQPSDSVLAVAPDGHVIVANDTRIPAGWATEVRSLAPGESTFGPPQTVTDTSDNDPLAGAAIANGGAAAITTSHHLTVRATGTAMFPTATAAAGVPVSASDLFPSFTANGEFVLFDVEQPSGSTEYALAARVQPTPGDPLGPMQATGLTSDATGDPVLAPFGTNDVAAGWEHRPDGASTFRAGIAMGDGAAPVLGAVSAPQTGPAGSALAFTVAPTDELGIADVQWGFGDGAQVTGTDTTHAFAMPGASTWSVTASDVIGNTASASGGLTIEPPPPVVVPDKLAVRITRPHRGTRARTLRRVRGTASGPVSRVDVAVVRVRRSACRSLTPTGRLAKKARPAGRTGCTAGRFLQATGTTSWALRLRHRLPAGRYVVFARARSAVGAKSPVARITMTLRAR